MNALTMQEQLKTGRGGPLQRRIGEVMSSPPLWITAGATVLEAARIMRDQGVDAVAVLDRRGVAAGIVTGVDLIALPAR